jgi:PRTRC genetic system protein B
MTAHASLESNFTPSVKQDFAVIVYTDVQRNTSFCTQHKIKNNKLEAGTLLSLEALEHLARDFWKSEVTVLDETILVHEPGVLVWWKPSQEEAMFFQTRDSSLDALSGQVFAQPPLVFIVYRRSLKVYALLENVRPKANTPLYAAPYFNITGGAVCLGSMPMPNVIHPNQAKAINEAFFASAFTHGTTERVLNWEGSISEFWAEVKHAGDFPTTALKPADTTLEKAIKGVV